MSTGNPPRLRMSASVPSTRPGTDAARSYVVDRHGGALVDREPLERREAERAVLPRTASVPPNCRCLNGAFGRFTGARTESKSIEMSAAVQRASR